MQVHSKSTDKKKPSVTLHGDPRGKSAIWLIIDIDHLSQKSPSDAYHTPPSPPGFQCELLSPPPSASPSENGTPYPSRTTTRINITSPTGNKLSVELRGSHRYAQRIVISAPSTWPTCLDTYQVKIDSINYFSGSSIVNVRHLNIRTTDKFTLVETRPQTLDGSINQYQSLVQGMNTPWLSRKTLWLTELNACRMLLPL